VTSDRAALQGLPESSGFPMDLLILGSLLTAMYLIGVAVGGHVT
jgi:hypothetical protein